MSVDWKPTLCLYHGNCKDGFAAAWAIWRRWPDAKFVPVYHGAEMPDVAGEDVLFVDFAPKIDWIWGASFKSKSMGIIDHHKTSAADMARLIQFDGTAVGLDYAFKTSWTQNSPELAVWFDMEKSGCRMAWEFAHGAAPVPSMLLRIEDRDLWRFVFHNTREATAAVDSYPMDFEMWDMLMDQRRFAEFCDMGVALVRAHDMVVEELLRNVYMMTMLVADEVYSVPVVNAPYRYVSDVSNRLLKLCPEAPFSVGWSRAGKKIHWSLRSEEGRMDVSVVARERGGGGHRNAAGFETIADGETD